jgi:tetratricopeptide (TPR) repeat protein
MEESSDASRKVRLRTDRLAALMAEGDWSAHRLNVVAGEPSKRSINRWLKQGAGAADQLAVTEWRYVTSVAEALGVSPLELVDTAERAAGGEIDRWLRLSAALGPRVYPELLAHLGFDDLSLGDQHADAFLVPIEGYVTPAYRFVRWTHCEEILRDETCLPPRFAREALLWAASRGLSIDESPELYCQANLSLGNAERSWEAGHAWIKEAARRNVQAEALWVGERLIASPLPGSPQGTRTRIQVLLSHARSLRISGRAERAIEVLTDLSMLSAMGVEPLVRARILIELAQSRTATGQAASVAVALADDALATLAQCESNQVTVDATVEAYLSRFHALQMQGDTAAAIRSHQDLDEYARSEPRVQMARFFRMTAAVAFEVGDIHGALAAYENGIDVASAEGNMREVLLGQINVAISHALLGQTEAARRYFEQSVAAVAPGDSGPFDVATVHLNFGEFAWEQGWYPAARRHLQIATHQCEVAGSFPLLRSRSAMLLADTLSALGELAEARRWARDAYKHALLCQSPADEAAALVALAHCHLRDGEAALGWANAAEARLAGLPPRCGYMVTARIRRRIAEARYRLGVGRAALSELRSLQVEAHAGSQQIEVAAIERLLREVSAEAAHP